jgi:ribonuclease BN (tRNA processing enzyme)
MSQIELQLLGTGDAFGDGGRYQTCFWARAADYRFLIDCGATSLSAIKRFGVNPGTIDAILVSHFHADHYGGLPFFILDAQFSARTQPLAIVGPAGLQERLKSATELLFPGASKTRQKFEISFHELRPREPQLLGPLCVTGFDVAHSPGTNPLGLRVEAAGKVIAYSGDTEWTNALTELARAANLFICESYAFEKRIPYHLNYRTLRQHRHELSAQRLVLTHFGPEMLARLSEVEFECAEDGKSIAV